MTSDLMRVKNDGLHPAIQQVGTHMQKERGSRRLNYAIRAGTVALAAVSALYTLTQLGRLYTSGMTGREPYDDWTPLEASRFDGDYR